MSIYDNLFDDYNDEELPKVQRKLHRSKKLSLPHEEDITEPIQEWPKNSKGIPVPPLTIKLISEGQLTPRPSFKTNLTIMYFLRSTMAGLSIEKAESEFKALRNNQFDINFRILLKTDKDLHEIWTKYKETYLDIQADSLLFLEDLNDIPKSVDKLGNVDVSTNELKLRESKIRLKQWNLEKLHKAYKKDQIDLQAGSQLGVVIIPQKGE
jgi:hypothetical protein